VSVAKVGRPCTYTDEIAYRLCEDIANGKTLKTACAGEEMPSINTVFRWLASNESFRELYARAKEDQADLLADEIINIADDSSDDPQSRRVRVDARKWVASKLKPKRYGDRLHTEQSGEVTVRHEVFLGKPPT
jgi:hypothetical protein